MSWEIRKNIQKVIDEAAKIKKRLPEKVINIEGNPEHEILDSEILDIQLLNEFSPSPFPISFEAEHEKIASIDSSSRYLRDYSVNQVLVGLSIYSTKKGFIDGPYSIEIPYLGISSYEKFLQELEREIPDTAIRVKNYVNYYFVNEEGKEYKIDDIADELRTEAESIALSSVLDHDLVILDGPIYPTPLELTEKVPFNDEARECHKIAYAKLVKDRASLLRDNVVGVVKRLENSKKLSYEPKIVEAFKKRGIKIEGLKDPDVLSLIDLHFCRGHGSYSCIIGPFKIKYNLKVESNGICAPKGAVLDNAPPKYAYYVILRRPYQPASYFRIEGLKDPEKAIKTIFSRVTEKLLPTFIELVDKRSKRVSASLFLYAYEVASTRLDIIHDDKQARATVEALFSLESR